MPLEPPVPEWTPEPNFFDGVVVVPIVFGAFLVAAAPLVWAGAHGVIAAELVLYWGGIAAIVLGVVAAFLLGFFSFGALSLGGILWVALERLTLATGPSFGWSAVPLAVVGLIVLPGALRRARAIAAARQEWRRTKGGSVPP
jgi:hypothetical protein